MELQQTINLTKTLIAERDTLDIDRTVDLGGHVLTFSNGNVVLSDPLSFVDNTNFIRMFSPDGSPWLVTVSNAGAIVVTADS